MSELDLELYASLGANHDLAHRLAYRGLHPGVLCALDHPNSEQYADNANPDLGGDEYVDSIVRNFPAFDPAVLEHAATRPWSLHDCTSGQIHTPGPLNRYMMVRDAGIWLPALYDAFNTFEQADLDRWADLVRPDTDRTLHIREDGIHITLSVDGAMLNLQAEAARVAVALGGEPSPAIRILDAWNAATRTSWPNAFDWRAVSDAVVDVDTDGADPITFASAVSELCDEISRRRFAALAPSLPTWVEAFVVEHPDLDD